MSRLVTSIIVFSTLLFTAPLRAAEVNVSVVSSDSHLSEGRLYLVFRRDDKQEPRFYSAWPTANIEPMFATDLSAIEAGNSQVITDKLIGFPHKQLADLPEGDWYWQAIYDTNFYDAEINSIGNRYSQVTRITKDSDSALNIDIKLDRIISGNELPDEQKHLKFVNFRSQKLSDFWQHDMYLKAGVILPASYFDNPLKKFPVYFNIGGYHSRYTRAETLYNNEAFQQLWFAEDTPQMVIVFLDGDAPFGDPYQIDSANNGPYGQATWYELMPHLTEKFNLAESAEGRFVSGCSTGGWVSLALQLYYPDLFNGAWSFSADGVDFRYFQLVNIYEDDNAFVNKHGMVRPSFRSTSGEPIFSIQHEIHMENAIGRNNSYITSGGQWGGWNAVFGPKGEDGLPMPIWDKDSGEIDKQVAEQWQRFDLRKYTEDNWQWLGPKVAGKLNIWMGDMDNFYLNNAMYLFEEMLQQRTEPRSDAKFTWARGKGHCDYNQIDQLQGLLSEMHSRYRQSLAQ